MDVLQTVALITLIVWAAALAAWFVEDFSSVFTPGRGADPAFYGHAAAVLTVLLLAESAVYLIAR